MSAIESKPLVDESTQQKTTTTTVKRAVRSKTPQKTDEASAANEQQEPPIVVCDGPDEGEESDTGTDVPESDQGSTETSPTTDDAKPEPVVEKELSPLSVEELAQLKSEEAIIHDGMDRFIAVGIALATVRLKRLFRHKYKSFEAYVEGRWGFSKQRAYQLIQAADFHKANEHHDPNIKKCKTERALRDYIKVPADYRIQVIEAIGAEDEVTAEQIVEAKDKIVPKKATKPNALSKVVLTASRAAKNWAKALEAVDLKTVTETEKTTLLAAQTTANTASAKITWEEAKN